MEKVVFHDLFIDVVHEFKRLKYNQQLVKNFTYGVLGYVTSQWSSKLVMENDIVCTFASFQSVSSNKEAKKYWELTREILRRDVKNVWWMMMGWNPKEDETLPPIVKNKRQQKTRWLMVRWWEYIFFYVYFLFYCLFVGNVDYGLLFFRWHFFLL
jgi:hypothetical protein